MPDMSNVTDWKRLLAFAVACSCDWVGDVPVPQRRMDEKTEHGASSAHLANGLPPIRVLRFSDYVLSETVFSTMAAQGVRPCGLNELLRFIVAQPDCLRVSGTAVTSLAYGVCDASGRELAVYVRQVGIERHVRTTFRDSCWGPEYLFPCVNLREVSRTCLQ